jgi:hypothetical protein
MPEEKEPKDLRPIEGGDQQKNISEAEQPGEQSANETPEESLPEEPKDVDDLSDAEEPTDDMTADEAPKPEATPAPAVTPTVSQPPKRRGLKRFFHWYGTHKKVSIPLTIIVVIAVLAGIPWTRYAAAGMVLRQSFSVAVTDAQTKQPITSALVTLDGQQVKTDNKGVAKIRAHVGNRQLQVSKKYYTSASHAVLVPILKQKGTDAIQLTAIGRQVAITVTNKISGKPVANATVTAAETEVKTDKNGQATMVLPADKSTVSATFAASGFNNVTANITVTAQAVPANTFALTPSGKLYFLSNLSGKIDVVKTNLDGTDRQTVLAGTGKEEQTNTILLASRDWHYLALLSKRDGGDNAKVFLIDTTNDSLTTMDEGDANFQMDGWSNHRFIYTVFRNGGQLWQSNRQAIKSFDADSKKLTTIDQTVATGSNATDYSYQEFTPVYILPNELVYGVNWNASYNEGVGSKEAALISVKPDGSNKHGVHGFSMSVWSAFVAINLRLYEPQGIYIVFNDGKTDSVYAYEDGQVKVRTDLSASTVYDTPYSTYLVSPAGTQTFWSESRDGKNTLFVGDDSGAHGTQIASLSDYAAYGWYTDNYLLVSKDGSELAIMPVGGGTPLKVSDYYKPHASLSGYGSGYGGL